MRDRHKGFAKFIREVNPVNSVQSTRPKIPWSREEMSNVRIMESGLCTLEQILEGAPLGDLYNAFVWHTSPQGHDYWSSREAENTPMSDEDYEFCRQLLEIHS